MLTCDVAVGGGGGAHASPDLYLCVAGVPTVRARAHIELNSVHQGGEKSGKKSGSGAFLR